MTEAKWLCNIEEGENNEVSDIRLLRKIYNFHTPKHSEVFSRTFRFTQEEDFQIFYRRRFYYFCLDKEITEL